MTIRPYRLARLAMVTALAVLAVPASSPAVTGVVTEFPVPSAGATPFGITRGPDGNVWFTEKGVGKIGKITPAGVVTEYVTEPGSAPERITPGPDGNLWYTDPGVNKYGKITPAGVVTPYGLLGLNNPRGIAAGADGNLYVIDAGDNQIVKLTTAGTKLADITIPTGASNSQDITRGPDGNMWFTEFNGDRIGRVNVGLDTINEFPVGAGKSPLGIGSGPDLNIWFTEAGGAPRIARINTAGGDLQETPVLAPGTSDPEGINAGQDGAMWVAIFNGSQIGRVTTGLGLQQFGAGITPASGPRWIVMGADGNMWVTEETGNMIGRITVDPPPSPSPGAGPGAAQAAVAPVPLESPDTGIRNCLPTVLVGTDGTAKLCDAVNPPTASTAQSLTGALPVAKAQAAARKSRKPRKKLRLASGQTTIPAGQTRQVTVKLTARAKKALRRGGTLKAAVTIDARGEDGQTATVKRQVKLKAVKKRSRKKTK